MVSKNTMHAIGAKPNTRMVKHKRNGPTLIRCITLVNPRARVDGYYKPNFKPKMQQRLPDGQFPEHIKLVFQNVDKDIRKGEALSKQARTKQTEKRNEQSN